MALVSQKRILAKQMVRSSESTNALKTMALVSQKRILANQLARTGESTNNLQPTKNQQSPKMAPPGPGWTFAFNRDELTQRRCHWISPTLKLEFTRRPPACIFEELRKEFGFDEVVALEKYYERTKGPTWIRGLRSTIRSISFFPSAKTSRAGHEYHRGLVKHSTKSKAPDSTDSLVSQKRILAKQIARIGESTNKLQPTKNHQSVPRKAPPGPGWTSIRRISGPFHRWHWISPTLKFEFTRRPKACLFEELRKEFGFDEVVALEKYRERNQGTDARIIVRRSAERSISSSPNAKKRRSGHQYHRGLVKPSTKSEASDSTDSLLMCNATGGK
jgi:hypothetical protein